MEGKSYGIGSEPTAEAIVVSSNKINVEEIHYFIKEMVRVRQSVTVA